MERLFQPGSAAFYRASASQRFMRLKDFLSRFRKLSPDRPIHRLIRWAEPDADTEPEERRKMEIQDYLNHSRRVACQRDYLADLRYGSAKYRTTLKEIESQEQELFVRRQYLSKLYPLRTELKRPSAWERRQALIADENRLFAASACLAGLLIAAAGVSGFFYDRVQPDASNSYPFICLGLAASGLLLSGLTSRHVIALLGARLRTREKSQ